MCAREKYLSRWSRENTPTECVDRFCSNVRRSFTPVRDIAGYEACFAKSTDNHSIDFYTKFPLQNIRNDRRSRSVDSYRSPLGIVTAPYRTNVNYYQENQPVS